jgi:6-phosphogluconolactonase
MPDFHVYASSHLTGEVYMVRGDAATGALERIQAVPLGGQGLAMTQSIDRRFLYVLSLASLDRHAQAHFTTLRIDPASGRLDPVGRVPAPAYMVHLSVDRNGRYLLGASEPTGIIASTPIGRRGLPQEAPADVMAALGRPHHVTTDASNRFAYVPCMRRDTVLQLLFDERTGHFARNAPADIHHRAGAGPRHMAHHPNGAWAYLVNQHDGSLVVYDLDRTSGRLVEIARDSVLPDGFAGSPRASQIQVTPDGRFLFVAERTGQTIAGWRIDPLTGRLADRRITPCDVGLRCFDIDLTSRYVVIGGVDSDKAAGPNDSPLLASYAIDPETGALAERGRAHCGDGIYWVEIVDLP